MPKTRPPDSPEFRQKMIALVRARRTPEKLELGVTAFFAYGATCWWVLWSRGAKPVFTVHYRSAVVPGTTLNASLAAWLGRLFAVALLHIPTFIVLYELFRPEES